MTPGSAHYMNKVLGAIVLLGAALFAAALIYAVWVLL